MPFDSIDIAAKGEQAWRGWIAAACTRLSAEKLTLSLEQQLGRESVAELMGIFPYEANPAVYESAVYAACLAVRTCWAKVARNS
jgi:hypothetical protein